MAGNITTCIKTAAGAYAEAKERYVKTAADAYTQIKEGYVKAKNPLYRVLPPGYRQLLYIESTGSQCINTAFKHNQNTRVVIDAQVTSKPSTHGWLFEGRSSYNEGGGSKGVFLLSGDTWSADYENGSSNRVSVTGVGVTDMLHVDFNKNVLTVNNFTYTWAVETFQSTVNLYLLACNDNGTANYFLSAKLYLCQIYDDAMLTSDFVPCMNADDEAGLYDMVSGAFFGNAGTGAFVAGPEVREYEGFMFYQSTQDISTATVTLGAALTYSGSVQTKQVASVVLDGKTLVEGTDYTVSGNTGTNAGNYTLTITGIGDYDGTVTAAWSIAKATGTISVSASTVYADSAVSGSNTISYTGDGAISVSSNKTSVATVSRSGTKVTVKAAGNGSATITVTMAEGTNYTGASKTFKVYANTAFKSYTGAYTRATSVYTIDGAKHMLYTITGSGTLALGGAAECFLVGGGGDGDGSGTSSNSRGGGGGGGGYVLRESLSAANGIVVSIGAAKGSTSIGSLTAAPGETPTSASGGDGGSGGGSSGTAAAGTGAGVSTYPFGLTALNAHSAGGGGGVKQILYTMSSTSGPAKFTGNNGGTGGENGADGSAGTSVSNANATTTRRTAGSGGTKGGGKGGAEGTEGKGASATFYGSGGGGAGDGQYQSGNSRVNFSSEKPGSGYQGVAYLAVKVA